MFIDLVVHCRLGKARLIPFVMTITPVTDQIDHEVLVELVAIGERGPCRFDARDRVIRIDMNDRDLKTLCHIAGMQAAARFMFIGGKAQLVVGDDMDCATRPHSRAHAKS